MDDPSQDIGSILRDEYLVLELGAPRPRLYRRQCLRAAQTRDDLPMSTSSIRHPT
jgi:hypothetical protein